MSAYVQEKDRHKNYPPLSRIEWHLFGSRYFAYAIDHVLSPLRLRWHEWRRRRLLEPSSLLNFESCVYSQNGEDGVLREIFARIGETNRFSVEFGFGDGSECCTRRLLADCGWSGLLVDYNDAGVENATRLYAGGSAGNGAGAVRVLRSRITADNILDTFAEARVPQAPDLLVVDIDGNDHWVLERILAKYRPRVVVCEYNATWGPRTDWAMPYDPDHAWDGSAYYGASLAALARITRARGYLLVGCESRGVNAFFVREDLIGDRFPDARLGLRLYVPPHYGAYGHGLRFRRGVSLWRKWGILKPPPKS